MKNIKLVILAAALLLFIGSETKAQVRTSAGTFNLSFSVFTPNLYVGYSTFPVHRPVYHRVYRPVYVPPVKVIYPERVRVYHPVKVRYYHDSKYMKKAIKEYRKAEKKYYKRLEKSYKHR